MFIYRDAGVEQDNRRSLGERRDHAAGELAVLRRGRKTLAEIEAYRHEVGRQRRTEWLRRRFQQPGPGELINQRVARFIAPVRSEGAKHQARMQDVDFAKTALFNHGVGYAFVERAGLAVFPFLLRHGGAELVGAEQVEDVDVAVGATSVPRGNAAARDDDFALR